MNLARLWKCAQELVATDCEWLLRPLLCDDFWREGFAGNPQNAGPKFRNHVIWLQHGTLLPLSPKLRENENDTSESSSKLLQVYEVSKYSKLVLQLNKSVS